jgi:hypothetical protein
MDSSSQFRQLSAALALGCHAALAQKKDMEDLAAWFASQKSALHDQR